ncbi:DoxX family membrane protein [Aureimonas altamirensis]|uniref:DoxX family protein n=1 Tax=Aureimonas altamirensis TaxID=370622 RepID=UPI001E522884|nr:DoxX family membrane protein [Aureimonas altamirensis]UHD47013.1 DoxX family membrane protein [Aureimonas altamirensis]
MTMLPETAWRKAARLLLAAFFALAGIAHFAYADALARIVPPFIPAPVLVVQLTGLAELAGAIGLLTGRFRRAAGIALAFYCLCVWPANFYHALLDWRSGIGLPMAYHALRLPLQPLLIAWCLWVGGSVRGR